MHVHLVSLRIHLPDLAKSAKLAFTPIFTTQPGASLARHQRFRSTAVLQIARYVGLAPSHPDLDRFLAQTVNLVHLRPISIPHVTLASQDHIQGQVQTGADHVRRVLFRRLTMPRRVVFAARVHTHLKVVRPACSVRWDDTRMATPLVNVKYVGTECILRLALRNAVIVDWRTSLLQRTLDAIHARVVSM